jgi:hypothetical protein
MKKKMKIGEPVELPDPSKVPATKTVADPLEPVVPKEIPDRVPFESPFETRPNELTLPGERFNS